MISFSRLSSLAALLLLCLMPLSAQLRLGYCGEEPVTNVLRNSSTTSTISCAMALTPEMTADYAFASIASLRIALAEPQNLATLRIWVREALGEGEELAAADINPTTLTPGWNSLEFTTPVSLQDCGTLYCGYSYTQSAANYIPVSGQKGTNDAFWIAANGHWQDYSKKYAPVCIQAELSSSYQHAAQLNSVQFEHAYTSGSPLTLQFGVRNLGTQPLTSVVLEGQMPDENAWHYPIDLEDHPLSLGENGYYQVEIPYPTELTGADQRMTISLTAPNGQPNENQRQTTDSLYFEVASPLPALADSPMLVELFTSEGNGLAPAGLYHAEQALGLCKRPTIVISRHEGYGPDDFWAVAGSDYEPTFFGPERLTFAPALWAHRQGMPLSATLPEDSLADYLNRIEPLRYADINLSSWSFDKETRQLSALLDVQLHAISAFHNPSLVVCLAEDEVVSIQQRNYYPDRYPSDSQKHVIRQYAPLSDQGSLLTGLDLEAVQHGRVSISNYASQQISVTLSVPEDVELSGGDFRLVFYISDRGFTNTILAVNEALVSFE